MSADPTSAAELTYFSDCHKDLTKESTCKSNILITNSARNNDATKVYFTRITTQSLSYWAKGVSFMKAFKYPNVKREKACAKDINWQARLDMFNDCIDAQGGSSSAGSASGVSLSGSTI